MKTRRFAPLALSLLLTSSGVLADAEIEVTLANCGPHRGFAGYITENGTTVSFQACETDTGSYSEFWDTSSTSISKVIFTIDPKNLTYYIAGIDVSGELSPEDEDAIDGVLTSDEAPLVDVLVPKLIKLGMDKDGTPMVTLLANTVGFTRDSLTLGGQYCDDCTSASTDCLGCCGLGCGGCTGICTDECYSHDLCVRQLGHRACLVLLWGAVLSVVDCGDANPFHDGENCC